MSLNSWAGACQVNKTGVQSLKVIVWEAWGGPEGLGTLSNLGAGA